MHYIDIKNYFNNSRYEKFIMISLAHISNLNQEIKLNNDFFILCNKFSLNNEVDFYIKLNNFFNENKPIPYDETNERVTIKVLLSMASGCIPLIKNIDNIPISFFIIHSAIDYGITLEIPHAKHNNFQNTLVGLFIFNQKNPNFIGNYFSIFLTYIVLYAKRYSTDYHLINDLIYNIQQVPNLVKSISTENFHHLLCQLLDWSYDNKHPDIKLFYDLLNQIQNSTKNNKIFIEIEVCLFRYREQFDKNYDYNQLIDFFEKNKHNIHIIDKLRILTQLLLKVDRDKYINLFSKELSYINNNTLIQMIENTNPDTFSAYFTNIAFYKYDDFLDLIYNIYGCSKHILESTLFYIHSNDYKYMITKNPKKFEYVDKDEHFNIIQYINKINNLGITVFGESIEQQIDEEYNPSRENTPTSDIKLENRFIQLLETYYLVNKTTLYEDIEFIFLMQHIRIPIQQLLLKKYNKLFPIVKIVNKIRVPEKDIKNVLHIVLSESSTIEQEKNVIEFLNAINKSINFEYKYIDCFQDLLEILKSDKYDIISITSHGEINTREPLNNVIKVGNKYIPWYQFEPEIYNINNRRLLYLNFCDSGHFALKKGFILESFSTYLTNSYQTTVSHMWPVNQNYSSVFLMIFLHHLTFTDSYKEAYSLTLLLAINNKFNEYIEDNDLNKMELFKVFQNSSLEKNSIIHWGSLLYQE